MIPLALVAAGIVGPLAGVAPAGSAPDTPASGAAQPSRAEGAPAWRGTIWTGTLRSGVRSLRVATEVRIGYDRDLFNHWISQGEGCDTRDRVLIAEAKVAPTIGADCALSDGEWRSYYDGVTTTDPGTFDVDHMVALAEAWDSGARRWNEGTRQRFANDLGDARTLVAVTASSNRSKGDQDPAEWMPAERGCRYVREFVAVKIRWSLSVNPAEKRFLADKAASCKDVTLTLRRAKIGKERQPGR